MHALTPSHTPFMGFNLCVISTHCLHFMIADKKIRGPLYFFTHEKRRQQWQRLYSTQIAPFCVLVGQRRAPAVELCWERKNGKARLSFHKITISLWKALGWNSVHRTACCLAAFKENNVWFNSPPLIFPLCLGLPFFLLHFYTSWDEKAIWLPNGCVAFKNTRLLPLTCNT